MGHDHGHAHGAADHRGRLAAAFGVSVVVLLAQAVGAVVTGSLALLVDTAHLLTDTGGLALALVAAHLSRRPPSPARTWGYRRAEVLAALGQAAVLLAVGVYVLVEAVQRLVTPPEIPSSTLVVFGLVGLVGNLVALAVLAGGRSANLNLRAAFLEVANDALGSLGVVVAAVVIATTGWLRADAVAALLIGALILPRALRLLRETTAVLLESTPPGLDLDEVRTHLLRVQHVREVHDLHASLIATGLPVISAHVVVDDGCFSDGHAGRILDELQECVARHFDVSVEHSTFQVETASHRAHEHSGHA
ncbi:cation diffusion facilitator family transporter [Cellulomonas fimi]|uniref:Cation diffusion facilitator family transporter n=1 Tax=Cellulomonas fimi (strain ATCC 484 / DSM 20113 / JCM 1341 / CCUG 24087 / LMG 16345 / NBRC 15513 / NCIMB 8980 / NCTC 7547 / NRS-133) TaxID=590998 RepID=F4H4S8_CELFA|nr:cation diffusion facilitator family transporter [Cellulomonas fimi]AEE44279.1 cation diffusion facilitator family transporter [Cellulomonas fimi ATCC 484]NNH05726.1 cation transporter [Cellulomonas fimi]